MTDENVSIPEVGTFNRWAAFTDDELDYILDGLNLALGAERPRLPLRDGLLRWQRIKAIARDAQTELARRKAAADGS